MIVEIYQSEKASCTASGYIFITREHGGTKRLDWKASQPNPDKPWRIRFARECPPWIRAAARVITEADLKAEQPAIMVEIQLQDKITSGRPQVIYGSCTVGRAEIDWAATTNTGRLWNLVFTPGNPPSWLENGIRNLIKAALKAGQSS
ncbi:MAG: hypothetical protein Q8N84_04210 [bacterium]|nr:hypothetical protein [bacterium]